MFNVHTIFFNNPVVAYFDTKFWIYSFIFANFTKYFSPWNLMTTSIDVLFNTCLWINLMSAIYWMCYMFHSICGKRKPWIKLNGQGTNWSQPCHSHCWFYHRHPVIKWPFEIQKFYHPKKHQPLLLFTFIQTLIHWSKEIVLFYILTKKYLYFIILYILLLSRASSAMSETSIPGRERLSRNSVEKVQLLLLFCDYMVYRLNLCLLLYCYQICTYENNEKWVNSFIPGISHLINYWNKSFKNLLIFVFFIEILQWI